MYKIVDVDGISTFYVLELSTHIITSLTTKLKRYYEVDQKHH